MLNRPSKPGLLSNTQIQKLLGITPGILLIQGNKHKKGPKVLLLKTIKTSGEGTLNKWQLCAVRAPCTVGSANAAIILNIRKSPHFLSTSTCFRQKWILKP